MKILVMSLCLALLLASCGSDDSGSGADSPVGEWQLVSGTVDASPFPMVDTYPVTFILDADGSFSGRAACNGYGGSGDLDGSTLTVAEWSITEMGCEPDVMASEQAFIRVLQGELDLERNADGLAMRRDGVDLQFAAIPPVPVADLVGTTWELHTIFAGDAATQFRGDGMLRLDEDGTFVASTGCRDVTGTYVLVADEIQVTSMTATGECRSDLERQDSDVISVLEAPRVEIDGDQLRLWTPGGEGLGFRATS